MDRQRGQRGPPGLRDNQTSPHSVEFFLWGFVEDEVYFLPMFITLKNLKNGIRKTTVKTELSLLQDVFGTK
jgi:hypothetical protein